MLVPGPASWRVRARVMLRVISVWARLSIIFGSLRLRARFMIRVRVRVRAIWARVNVRGTVRGTVRVRVGIRVCP